jgi:hypothetical protein
MLTSGPKHRLLENILNARNVYPDINMNFSDSELGTKLAA